MAKIAHRNEAAKGRQRATVVIEERRRYSVAFRLNVGGHAGGGASVEKLDLG